MGVAATLKAGIQFRKAEAAAALVEPRDADAHDDQLSEAAPEVRSRSTSRARQTIGSSQRVQGADPRLQTLLNVPD